MKVKDLIAELQTADPEADLSFQMADGCCGDQEFLELSESYFDEYLQYNLNGEPVRDKSLPHGLFLFYFSAPWFLASCRKSGAAKRGAQEVIDANKAWKKEQEEKSKKSSEEVP